MRNKIHRSSANLLMRAKLVGCNIAIYCTLVVWNIFIVGCAEPWFTQAMASCRSSPVPGQTEPSINGSSRAPGFGREPSDAASLGFGRGSIVVSKGGGYEGGNDPPTPWTAARSSRPRWQRPAGRNAPSPIMRRARPYRGENSGPGKDRYGELDTQTRN
jgi:hypothetical protein